MKSKKFNLILALVITAGAITFAWGGRNRVLGQGLIPFGGRILMVEYCCNGVAITVGPPRPGRFMITAGTLLYPFYNMFRVGPSVLGTAMPAAGTPCMEVATACLVPIPVLGLITRIGSSAF